MRIASVILAILGGLASAGLGAKWISDANELRGAIALARSMGVDTAQIDSLVRGGYVLIASLLVAIVASVLTLRGRSRVGGALMLAGALAPAVFEPKALVFTSLLALGGVLSLLARARPAAPANRAPAIA